MFVMPLWVKQLDTVEKLNAFLRFIRREDLITKLDTQGFLCLSDLLEALNQVDNYLIVCASDDSIDFIDFGKEAL
jgi:hypothetical protein